MHNSRQLVWRSWSNKELGRPMAVLGNSEGVEVNREDHWPVVFLLLLLQVAEESIDAQPRWPKRTSRRGAHCAMFSGRALQEPAGAWMEPMQARMSLLQVPIVNLLPFILLGV